MPGDVGDCDIIRSPQFLLLCMYDYENDIVVLISHEFTFKLSQDKINL